MCLPGIKLTCKKSCGWIFYTYKDKTRIPLNRCIRCPCYTHQVAGQPLWCHLCVATGLGFQSWLCVCKARTIGCDVTLLQLGATFTCCSLSCNYARICYLPTDMWALTYAQKCVCVCVCVRACPACLPACLSVCVRACVRVATT